MLEARAGNILFSFQFYSFWFGFRWVQLSSSMCLLRRHSCRRGYAHCLPHCRDKHDFTCKPGFLGVAPASVSGQKLCLSFLCLRGFCSVLMALCVVWKMRSSLFYFLLAPEWVQPSTCAVFLTSRIDYDLICLYPRFSLLNFCQLCHFASVLAIGLLWIARHLLCFYITHYLSLFRLMTKCHRPG